MITFLKIMIGFWICWIVFSILTRCYVSAIISLVVLLMDIKDLHYEIEQKEYDETIKEGLKLVDEVLGKPKDG